MHMTKHSGATMRLALLTAALALGAGTGTAHAAEGAERTSYVSLSGSIGQWDWKEDVDGVEVAAKADGFGLSASVGRWLGPRFAAEVSAGWEEIAEGSVETGDTRLKDVFEGRGIQVGAGVLMSTEYIYGRAGGGLSMWRVEATNELREAFEYEGIDTTEDGNDLMVYGEVGLQVRFNEVTTGRAGYRYRRIFYDEPFTLDSFIIGLAVDF